MAKQSDRVETPATPRRAEVRKGRGGARPGAGRKTKAYELQQAGIDPHADPDVQPGDAVGHSAITDLARQMAQVAITALARVANNPRAKHSDRIKAASELLTWGYGKPLGIGTKPAEKKEPELGKKAALEEAARNPDQSSTMGKILARRAGLRAVE